MNVTEVRTGYRPLQDSTLQTLNGSAVMESIGALVTLALAIVGLAGGIPITMAAIGTIIMGVAILIEGGGLASNYAAGEFRAATLGAALESRPGLAAEFLGGLAGIVLGILALLGVAPGTLLAVAVLIFGAAFVFSSSLNISSSTQAMLGFASLVLGLLAVSGLNPLTLVLVALACLGTAGFFRGAATSARMTVAERK
jgi:hypothetical protein